MTDKNDIFSNFNKGIRTYRNAWLGSRNGGSKRTNAALSMQIGGLGS